jgi:hypothetical protein
MVWHEKHVQRYILQRNKQILKETCTFTHASYLQQMHIVACTEQNSSLLLLDGEPSSRSEFLSERDVTLEKSNGTEV